MFLRRIFNLIFEQRKKIFVRARSEATWRSLPGSIVRANEVATASVKHRNSVRRSFFCIIIYMFFLIIPQICFSQETSTDDPGFDYTGFDTTLIAPGEKLVYTAYILGKMIPLGKAELEINEIEMDGGKFHQFVGTVNGGYLIFDVKMRLESLVDYYTLRPHVFNYEQSGFEKKIRKLDFDWKEKKIIYSKKKFWEENYTERARTAVMPRTRDILSTMYFARALKPEIHEKMVMNLIEKRDIWTVVVEVIDKKLVRLPSGEECKAMLVTITPHAIDKNNNKVFKGLFGLKGNISLWVTEDKRIPIQIEGDYTMGIIDLHITVVLDEWAPAGLVETEEKP